MRGISKWSLTSDEVEVSATLSQILSCGVNGATVVARIRSHDSVFFATASAGTNRCDVLDARLVWESTQAAIRMISAIVRSWSGRLIFSHMGGGAPFLVNRCDIFTKSCPSQGFWNASPDWVHLAVATICAGVPEGDKHE